MGVITSSCISVIASIIIFLILHLLMKRSRSELKNHNIGMENFLPKEEVKNIRQIGYLFIIFIIFIDMTYMLWALDLFDLNKIFFVAGYDALLFYAIDIILSLCLSLNLDLKKNPKDQILLLLLVPYGSIDFLLTLSLILMPFIPTERVLVGSLASLLNMIHLFGLICFIRIYYKKFLDYTKNNQLGLTLLLFFTLLVATFIITIITEKVTIMESINMVSNAFASNGYVVSGTTTIGVINETIIVWGGYIFSGVATATLTATIIIKHFESKFKHYGDMNERFDKLKEMIEEENWTRKLSLRVIWTRN